MGVDPLDGTQEFTRGNVEVVTVLIGFSVDGEARGGAIHVPFGRPQTRTLWGLVHGTGAGAYEFDSATTTSRRVQVPATASDAAAAVAPRRWVVTSISHMTPDTVVRCGGAGHKVLLVLNGAGRSRRHAGSTSVGADRDKRRPPSRDGVDDAAERRRRQLGAAAPDRAAGVS